MLEFSRQTTPVARKRHKCDLCGRPIAAGKKYSRFSGKYDGTMFDVKHHLFCAMLIDRYCYEMGEDEYCEDEVIDWATEKACSGCERWDDESDAPPCDTSIFDCEKFRRHFKERGGTRDDQ